MPFLIFLGHTEGLGFFPKNLVSRYRPFFARYFFISFQNHCYSQNRGSEKSIFWPLTDLGTFFWWSEVVRLNFLKVLEVLSQNRDFADFGTYRPCFAFLKFRPPKSTPKSAWPPYGQKSKNRFISANIAPMVANGGSKIIRGEFLTTCSLQKLHIWFG